MAFPAPNYENAFGLLRLGWSTIKEAKHREAASSIVQQYDSKGFLSEKQWEYVLGLSMKVTGDIVLNFAGDPFAVNSGEQVLTHANKLMDNASVNASLKAAAAHAKDDDPEPNPPKPTKHNPFLPKTLPTSGSMTGHFSSKSPSLSQVPKKSAMVPPGLLDPKDAYASGGDTVDWSNFGPDEKTLGPEITKALKFGALYGMGEKKLSTLQAPNPIFYESSAEHKEMLKAKSADTIKHLVKLVIGYLPGTDLFNELVVLVDASTAETLGSSPVAMTKAIFRCKEAYANAVPVSVGTVWAFMKALQYWHKLRMAAGYKPIPDLSLALDKYLGEHIGYVPNHGDPALLGSYNEQLTAFVDAMGNPLYKNMQSPPPFGGYEHDFDFSKGFWLSVPHKDTDKSSQSTASKTSQMAGHLMNLGGVVFELPKSPSIVAKTTDIITNIKNLVDEYKLVIKDVPDGDSTLTYYAVHNGAPLEVAQANAKVVNTVFKAAKHGLAVDNATHVKFLHLICGWCAKQNYEGKNVGMVPSTIGQGAALHTGKPWDYESFGEAEATPKEAIPAAWLPYQHGATIEKDQNGITGTLKVKDGAGTTSVKLCALLPNMHGGDNDTDWYVIDPPGVDDGDFTLSIQNLMDLSLENAVMQDLMPADKAKALKMHLQKFEGILKQDKHPALKGMFAPDLISELFDVLGEQKAIPAYLHWGFINVMQTWLYNAYSAGPHHPAMVDTLHDAFKLHLVPSGSGTIQLVNPLPPFPAGYDPSTYKAMISAIGAVFETNGSKMPWGTLQKIAELWDKDSQPTIQGETHQYAKSVVWASTKHDMDKGTYGNFLALVQHMAVKIELPIGLFTELAGVIKEAFALIGTKSGMGTLSVMEQNALDAKLAKHGIQTVHEGKLGPGLKIALPCPPKGLQVFLNGGFLHADHYDVHGATIKFKPQHGNVLAKVGDTFKVHFLPADTGLTVGEFMAKGPMTVAQGIQASAKKAMGSLSDIFDEEEQKAKLKNLKALSKEEIEDAKQILKDWKKTPPLFLQHEAEHENASRLVKFAMVLFGAGVADFSFPHVVKMLEEEFHLDQSEFLARAVAFETHNKMILVFPFPILHPALTAKSY